MYVSARGSARACIIPQWRALWRYLTVYRVASGVWSDKSHITRREVALELVQRGAQGGRHQ